MSRGINDQIINFLGDKVSAVGKTLFSGTWSVGSSKTVSGLNSYWLVLVYQNSGDVLIGSIDDSGYIRCVGLSVGTNGTQYVQHAAFSPDGSNYKLTQCSQLTHNYNTSHNGYTTRSVSKIIGIIPKN